MTLALLPSVVVAFIVNVPVVPVAVKVTPGVHPLGDPVTSLLAFSEPTPAGFDV
jgi:hypothetical protein